MKFWRPSYCIIGGRLYSSASASSYAYANKWRQVSADVSSNNSTLTNDKSSARTPAKIVQFGDQEFLNRIHEDHAQHSSPSAVHYQTFPRLGRLIKSFRPGELTVFTGPTGSGKTTLLAQLSLDYCFQGIKTLWGSFEVRNTRLARIMMEQVSGISSHQSAEDTDSDYHDSSPSQSSIQGERLIHAQNVLKQIPLYFMDYFGSVPLDSVLACLDAAVAEHGIQHVILDNLQFMLSGQHTSSLDKFDLTDRSVAALRAFSTSRNVHITLVIHPRKELDDTPLGLASVSGTAKATQEADNVVILQKVGDVRYLDVKKNRFDGELGTVRIRFNPENRLIYEE